jgi:hypothetical protein
MGFNSAFKGLNTSIHTITFKLRGAPVSANSSGEYLTLQHAIIARFLTVNYLNMF